MLKASGRERNKVYNKSRDKDNEQESKALERGWAAEVAEPLAKAAVALHESATVCGFARTTVYEAAGRWQGLMSMGLMSQVKSEISEWAEKSRMHAGFIQKMAA